MGILDKIRSEINDDQAVKVISNHLYWTTENGVEFSFNAFPLVLPPGESAEISIFGKRFCPQSAGLQELNVEEVNRQLMIMPSRIDFSQFVDDAKNLSPELARSL